MKSHSSPSGKHGSLNISATDGARREGGGVYTEFEISPTSKRNMRSSSLQCGITLTAEYLPSKLGRYSLEWKLAPHLFQRICQLRGTPEIDLFASRLSHQIKTYFSWRPDPLRQAADAFQQNWFHESLYAFPPFCMIPKALSKVLKEKVPMMILVTPVWLSQLWYPEAMKMSIQQPILLTWRRDLLKNPKGEIHLLVQSKTLELVPWTVSGLDCKRTEFEGRLPILSLNQ